MKSIATAIERLPQRQAPDAGCKPGQDDRSSDLCAQWKAADGAAASAVWTERAFWAGLAGLLIGGATLFFAGRAAHWAKEAATHTETGAKEAKRSADLAESAIERTQSMGVAQSRAYMSVSASAVAKEEQEIKITVEYTNSGSSPARNLQIGVKLLTGDRKYEEWKGRRPLGDVAAGRTGDMLWQLSLAGVDNKIASAGFAIILLTANYLDVFDNWQGDQFEFVVEFFPGQDPSIEPFPEWRHKDVNQPQG